MNTLIQKNKKIEERIDEIAELLAEADDASLTRVEIIELVRHAAEVCCQFDDEEEEDDESKEAASQSHPNSPPLPSPTPQIESGPYTEPLQRCPYCNRSSRFRP